MLKKILNHQTKNVSFATLILGVAYFASALLGLLRDRLLAGRFGAGNELDIYYAAFRIPDFIAMIMIIGSISAAVIPVFSSYLARSKEEAWGFFSALLNFFLIFLIGVSLILVIFAPYLISFIVPGFDEEKKATTVFLTRIMFLSPIILGISNIISGILQIFNRFFITALAPIMYNIGIILGILFFVPQIGLSGLAWGVVLGGFLHLIIQLPALFSSGFQYKRILTFKHEGVKRVIKLMLPRSLGLAASQINLVITTAIASTLISGSIAVFTLANNLSSLIIGVIAVPFSTAVFPFLSLAHSKNENGEFIQRFSSVFRQILFFVIPLSAILFVLRAQVVRLILGTGRFNWEDTRLTAACLGIFAFGLFAQGIIFLLSKSFYAIHNTIIPALVSVVTVVFAVVSSLVFVWLLKFPNILSNLLKEILRLQDLKNFSVIGLPLAFSLAAIFQFILLLVFLYKKIGDFKRKEILSSLYKILFATVLMLVFSYFARQISAGFLNMRTFLGIFIQTAITGIIAISSYVLLNYFLKSRELSDITSLVSQKFKKIKPELKNE